MILVDTSVWVQHFNGQHAGLTVVLEQDRALVHPYVIGELALGHIRRRQEVLVDLQDLPQAEVATVEEVLALIESAGLAGSGIGYVDAHLLASVRLHPGSALWTLDRRLDAAAQRLGVAHRALH